MNGLKLFFHNAKYTMLSMFRLKVTLFWTLAFPLLLATFMYMAFGNLFEKDEMFKTKLSFFVKLFLYVALLNFIKIRTIKNKKLTLIIPIITSITLIPPNKQNKKFSYLFLQLYLHLLHLYKFHFLFHL